MSNRFPDLIDPESEDGQGCETTTFRPEPTEFKGEG